MLERALEAHPGNPNVLYNLACCEALSDRRDDALRHLVQAVEVDPRLRDSAGTDPDLDSIRGSLENL